MRILRFINAFRQLSKASLRTPRLQPERRSYDALEILLQPVPAQRGGEVGRGLDVAVIGKVDEVAGEAGEVGHHVRALNQRRLRIARGRPR